MVADFILTLLHSIIVVTGARESWRERNVFLALMPLRYWLIALGASLVFMTASLLAVIVRL